MKLLSSLAGLAVLTMIVMGTWPILFGQEPVKPLVKIEKLEEIKDGIADSIKDFELD